MRKTSNEGQRDNASTSMLPYSDLVVVSRAPFDNESLFLLRQVRALASEGHVAIELVRDDTVQAAIYHETCFLSYKLTQSH